MKDKSNNKIHRKLIDLSIIIVNYKSWLHLQNCLSSIEQINEEDFTFEVIIVDNKSNDNKLEAFSKQFHQFKFISNTGNNGFSHGNNLGETHSKGEYLLFLNPDTIVTKDAILSMLVLARENSNYGIISCSKINIEGKPEKEIRFFPRISTLFGLSRFIYELINKQKILVKFNDTRDIIFPDWVSGSIIFMSKKWFDTINGWDEDYWLYLEDVDLCKRITNDGGKVVLTRKTNIIHNHGGASRLNINTAALTKAEVIISKHVYINKHFSKKTKIFTQFTLFISVVTTKFLFAIFGAIFFFIPKLYVNLLLFLNLINYYRNALIKRTWVSRKAPNYIR